MHFSRPTILQDGQDFENIPENSANQEEEEQKKGDDPDKNT